MADEPWQIRAQRRRTTRLFIMGLLFGAGLGAGFILGFFEDDKLGLIAESSVPAPVAIAVVVLFVLAVALGSWKLNRLTDELEQRINLRSTAAAGYTIMVGYPSWFLLWKGGLVPEPDAMILFFAAIGANALAYVYLKFRSLR